MSVDRYNMEQKMTTNDIHIIDLTESFSGQGIERTCVSLLLTRTLYCLIN